MKKSTLISLAVFVALIAAAVVLVSKKGERGIVRMSFEQVDAAAIDRVVVTGKNAVELKKDGDTWKLQSGRAADQAGVKRLTEAVPKLKSSDFVTRDSARYAELEVDDEKGSKVAAYAAGKAVATFVVGKAASGATFVRVGEDVFKVPATSPAMFSKPESSWIERKLFTDKLDDAQRLEVALAGQKPFALVKKDSAWTLEDTTALPKGFRFDPDQARSLVSSLVNLRVKDFEAGDPGADKTDFVSGDVFVLHVQPAAEPAKEGETAPAPKPAETRTLKLGKIKEGGSDVYGMVDGRADVFTLAESTAKALRKAPTDMRDLKLMSFDKAKAQALSIVDGKVNLTFEKKDGAWKLGRSAEPTPKDFELDPTAVDRRLTTLAGVRALRVVDGASAAAAGLGAAKVTVTLEGGQKISLSLGKETKDDNKDVIYARGNADDATYFVAKWTRQNLTGGLVSFKKQSEQPGMGGGMPNLDPAALSQLPPDVRESLMKQMQQKQKEQELLKQLQAKVPPAQP